MKCCGYTWSDRLGHDLKSILKVMNFANGRGKSWFDLKFLAQNVTRMKYQLNNYRINNKPPDPTSILPWCQRNIVGIFVQNISNINMNLQLLYPIALT